MKIVLILMVLLMSAHTFARKPAVEDFVGIEAETDPTPTPQGTEALFNFSKDVNQLEPSQIVLRNPAQVTPVENVPKNENKSSFPWAEVVGLFTVLGLPFVSFRMLKYKSHEKMAEVKNLNDYRKDTKDDDIKKAS